MPRSNKAETVVACVHLTHAWAWIRLAYRGKFLPRTPHAGSPDRRSDASESEGADSLEDQAGDLQRGLKGRCCASAQSPNTLSCPPARKSSTEWPVDTGMKFESVEYHCGPGHDHWLSHPAVEANA